MSSNGDEGSAKRQALTGQWTAPGYGQSYQSQPQNPVSTGVPNPLSTPIPTESAPVPKAPINEAEYANALKEAYRRGAEAAARMQQEPNAASSCPDLQMFDAGQPSDPTIVPSLVPDPLAPEPTSVVVPVPVQSVSMDASRSISLPDIHTIDMRAQAEEAKRKKRLARNRASARMRRLRKKNLVDAYEGEVGVLESSLQKLRSHSWGTNACEDLLDALSMERGQQELLDDDRVQLIDAIIAQMSRQLELLREAHLEQMILLEATDNPNEEICRDLNGILNLSEAQKEDIRGACRDIAHEAHAIEIFMGCMEAMRGRWVWNGGPDEMTKQFCSILQPNQLSKFLLWADANSEAIDELEICVPPPAHTEPQTGPIFAFGTSGTAASVAPQGQCEDGEH